MLLIKFNSVRLERTMCVQYTKDIQDTIKLDLKKKLECLTYLFSKEHISCFANSSIEYP